MCGRRDVFFAGLRAQGFAVERLASAAQMDELRMASTNPFITPPHKSNGDKANVLISRAFRTAKEL